MMLRKEMCGCFASNIYLLYLRHPKELDQVLSSVDTAIAPKSPALPTPHPFQL
jgi:hypothetical protein